MKERYHKVSAWVRNLKPIRVYRNYSVNGGNLSAAGMSFQAFFAIFAAVWIVFSVSGLIFASHQELEQAVIEFINTQIPGLIGENGAIKPNDLVSAKTLGWSGGLATLVLIYTAINLLEYTRVAMHRVFNVPRLKINYLLLKIWDLFLALLYGLLVLITSAGSIIAVNFASWAMSNLGADPSRTEWAFIFQVITLVLLLLVDMVILAGAIRILTGVPIPWRFLGPGVLLGGVTLSITKILGSLLLQGASKNPLFASFVVFVGVLIWFNITSRIFLLTASWIVTSMRDKGIEPKDVGWQSTQTVIKRVRERARERAARKQNKLNSSAHEVKEPQS